VALALAIVVVAGSTLFGDQGLAHLLRLRAERRDLGRAAFALLVENSRLHAEIDRLRTDDRHLEALARQEFGLVRPGEIVYRLKRDTDARQPPD
jgi:cell division protein FtsB